MQAVTADKVHHRKDIDIRLIAGGKHNIFDGNNLYAGRTLESILRSIEHMVNNISAAQMCLVLIGRQ